MKILPALLVAVACGDGDSVTTTSDVTLLNVSYDPTRELYGEINAAFAKAYRTKTGIGVTVKQSHGGSGKQARSVIDGLEADVVSLAVGGDIDAIATKGLTDKDWQKRLPDRSSPYTSTQVFVVRKGNPKAIRDWDDLVRPDLQVITPNPKTSGGSRWAYLAAWGFAKQKLGSDEAALEFLKKLFANVPVLDSGARGSTTTFDKRELGDVLLSWENEALLLVAQSPQKYEVVWPPRSILAEPPVAVIDAVVTKRKTGEVAKAYLDFLYSDEGQAIIAKHHYRPRGGKASSAKLPNIELFTIDDIGGWAAAHAQHFADGGTFDKIYAR